MSVRILLKQALHAGYVEHEAFHQREAFLGSDGVIPHRHTRPLTPTRSEFRNQRPLGLAFWGQWLVAMLLLLGLLYSLVMAKSISLEPHYRVFALSIIFCSLPIYSYIHVYDSRIDYLSVIRRLAVAWTILLGTLFCLAFVTKTGAFYSREVVLKWMILGFAVQCLGFFPLHALCHYYHRCGESAQKSLIIGSGELSEILASKLQQQYGESLAGLVHHSDDKPRVRKNSCATIGNVENLLTIIERQGIQKVYIALPAEDMGKVNALYVGLMDVNVDVVWVPDVTSMLLLNHSVSEVVGMPVICLNESPLTTNPSAAMIKCAVDFSIALCGLIALSPVLLSVAIAVKISSPGPVIFKQARHGWNGKVFQLYKFRSMRVHIDSNVRQATRDDNRVTTVGSFIRRTSIDELPQLFNVLLGDMSLVGPRPHAVAHNNYYSGKIRAYMNRHRIKPGITGLAQISGARGETDTLDKMEKRVRLDLEYINNWSLWRDIKILIKTPLTLLSSDVY